MHSGMLETINDCSCPIYWAIVLDESDNYKMKPLRNFASLKRSEDKNRGKE